MIMAFFLYLFRFLMSYVPISVGRSFYVVLKSLASTFNKRYEFFIYATGSVVL